MKITKKVASLGLAMTMFTACGGGEQLPSNELEIKTEAAGLTDPFGFGAEAVWCECQKGVYFLVTNNYTEVTGQTQDPNNPYDGWRVQKTTCAAAVMDTSLNWPTGPTLVLSLVQAVAGTTYILAKSGSSNPVFTKIVPKVTVDQEPIKEVWVDENHPPGFTDYTLRIYGCEGAPWVEGVSPETRSPTF